MRDTYKSLEEYCLDIAERSLSRAPEPPRAVSNVGRAAVVILTVYSFLNQIYFHKMLILLFYTFCLTWSNIGYAVDKKGFPDIIQLKWYYKVKVIYIKSSLPYFEQGADFEELKLIDYFPLIY